MFVLRIQAHGRRGWFDLEPDLEGAVKKARKLKEYLKLNGWAATLREYKYSADHESVRLTVADYIDLVAKHGCLDDKTVAGYAAAFRRIVGAIEKVPGTGRSKFSGGRKPSSWRKAVDLIDLNRITPAAVMEWRSTYMKGPGADSSRKVNAEHTVNTVIRNARSLFSRRVLRRLKVAIPDPNLPAPLPFEGVELLPERESDFHYSSAVNAACLIDAAKVELSGNCLIIFLLAICAGLRRNEIDKLLWEHVDLQEGTITVIRTEYNRLKSSSSAGRIKLSDDVFEILRQHHRTQGGGPFVLFSKTKPKPDSVHRHYRCNKDHSRLIAWLRRNGLQNVACPIHTLRKEFGSALAKSGGIFEASVGLRHSTIGVTRRHYLSSTIKAPTFHAIPAKPAEPAPPHKEMVAEVVAQVLAGLTKARDLHDGLPNAPANV